MNKKNYSHFLEKEIYETNDIVQRTISGFLQAPELVNKKDLNNEIINKFKKLLSKRKKVLRKIKKQYEEENNFKYDLVVNARFDLCFNRPFDFGNLPTNKFHIPIEKDKPEYGWPVGRPEIIDYIFASSSENMDKFSSLFDKLDEEIKEIETRHLSEGRIFVRASGTEPLLRVLIESDSVENIENISVLVEETISKYLNI